MDHQTNNTTTSSASGIAGTGPAAAGHAMTSHYCSRCRAWRTKIWYTRYRLKDPQNLGGSGLRVWATCNRCCWQKSGLPAADWMEIHCPWIFCDGYCPCHYGEWAHHDYGYCPTSGRKPYIHRPRPAEPEVENNGEPETQAEKKEAAVTQPETIQTEVNQTENTQTEKTKTDKEATAEGTAETQTENKEEAADGTAETGSAQ